MKKIYADDYNILPGREVAAQLNALLAALAADDGQKRLFLKKASILSMPTTPLNPFCTSQTR